MCLRSHYIIESLHRIKEDDLTREEGTKPISSAAQQHLRNVHFASRVLAKQMSSSPTLIRLFESGGDAPNAAITLFKNGEAVGVLVVALVGSYAGEEGDGGGQTTFGFLFSLPRYDG